MLLVDRVGRLPLLRASSAVALLVVTAVVVTATIYAFNMRVRVFQVDSVPRTWPTLQLATLAVVAVSSQGKQMVALSACTAKPQHYHQRILGRLAFVRGSKH